MYSTCNEEKFVVGERFNASIKNKSYKYMTAIQNGYIGNLNDLINQYNNTFHRTIRMKLVDGTFSAYIDYDKDFKFDVGDHVRISKYQHKIMLQTGPKNF